MDAPPARYATASDGYRIAYAEGGAGPPLLMTPIGFNHIQLSWRYDGRLSPWLEELTGHFRLIRYDSRGQGMSTRGLDGSPAMDDYVRDIEAVVDQSGINRFVLLGYAYYGHAAVRYAVDNPERVEALILISCPTSMAAWPSANFSGLSEQNWELFLRAWVPSPVTAEERDRYVDYFRQTVTQADWQASAPLFATSDITDLLPKLKMPTLVLYPRDLLWLSVEEAKNVAARIVDSRLALIDGALPMGDAIQGVKEIESFLAGLPASRPVPKGTQAFGNSPDDLSLRELEVLRLVAAGRSNPQIAGELVISINTVARHLSHIFVKCGVSNRTEAAGYARDWDLV